MTAPSPENESARLKALESFDIMDTPPDEVFDRIVRLAQRLIDVPIALISFIDRERQWCKSRLGLAVEELPRDDSFCAYTLLGEDVFEVADASTHPLFANNPLVTGEPNVRFYAGAPLITEDGYGIGTLSVFDNRSRRLESDQAAILKDLAAMAMSELDLRRRAAIDVNTGVFTRRHLVDLGERELRAARRYDYPLSVLELEVDGLDRIREAHGPKIANAVLSTVANHCKPLLREQDIMGRRDGERFVIVASHTDRRGAMILSEKLQVAVQSLAVDNSPGMLRVTVCIGATTRGGDDDNFAAMLDRAERALNDARTTGNGKVVVSAAA